MKKYDINKIVLEIKRKEKEENKFKEMLNNLLPSTIEDLKQNIAINSLLNNNY